MSDISRLEEMVAGNDNSFELIDQKRRELNEIQTFLGFETIEVEEIGDDKYQSLNRKEEQRNFNFLDEILNYVIPSAIKNNLKWSKTAISKVNGFFSKFADLEPAVTYQLHSFKFFPSKLRPFHFNALINVPIRENVDDPNYSNLMTMYSNIMQTFYVIFWRKPLEYKPVFRSQNMDLCDPFYKQKVRRMNLNDPEIDELLFSKEFNIKEFILTCLKKFIPHEATFWAQENHKAHIYSLKIMIEMFEYGLWTKKELNALNELMYNIVSSLSVYEDFITTQISNNISKFSEKSVDKYVQNLTHSRKFVGYAYLHMISLMHDDHLESALQSFEIENLSVLRNEKPLFVQKYLDKHHLFEYKLCKNKLFYTYMGYAMSTYFFKTVYILNKPISSLSLSLLLKKMMGYVSDSSIDFYFHSLSVINESSLPFYSLNDNNNVFIIPREIKKSMQNLIHGIETRMRDGTSSLLIQELEVLFTQILDVFVEVSDKPEVLSAYQLAFSLNNIPQYMLFMIHYLINQHLKIQVIGKCIRFGAHALAEIINNNITAMNCIGSGVNFLHLKKYAHFDLIGGAMIFSKIMQNSQSLLYIDTNPHFFDFFVKIYETLATKFSNDFDGQIETTKKNMTMQEFFALRLYNKIFKSSFKFRKSSRHKTEITLMPIIEDDNLKYLRFQMKRTMIDHSENEIEEFNKLLLSTGDWVRFPSSFENYIMEEVTYGSLSMFRQTVKVFHTEDVYSNYFEFFKNEGRLENFTSLTKSKRGTRMFNCVCKLFKTFMIFNRNCTFYYKVFSQKYKTVEVGCSLTEDDLKFDVIDQMKKVFDMVIAPQSVIEPDSPTMSLIVSIYLPTVFKFLCGFMSLMNDMMFENISIDVYHKGYGFFKILEDFMNRQKDYLDRRNPPTFENTHLENYINALENEREDYFFKQTLHSKIDNIRAIGKNLILLILKYYKHFPKKWWQIEKMIKFIHGKNLAKLKFKMNKRQEFSIKYRKKVKLDKAEFIHFDQVPEEIAKEKNADNIDKMMISQIKKSELNYAWQYSNRQYSRNVNTEEKLMNRDFEYQENLSRSRIVYYIKRRYKNLKGFLIDNYEKDKIGTVIGIEDDHSHNIQKFLGYFFYKISGMDFEFKDLQKNFFVNNIYVQLTFYLDNLMQNKKEFREKFFEFLIDKNNEKIVKDCLGKIWKLNKILLMHLIYKTFIDDEWINMFFNFYTLSNFLQNLCEDNYFYFKDWFSENCLNDELKVVALEEMHYYVENALFQTETYSSQDTHLTIRDREEMFPVFSRAIEGMTELINGGISLGDSLIYYKRMDIFVGIIFRVINDLDSTFYDLKENVIVYIQALLERQDTDIIEFVGRNFSVVRIFTLIKTLMKKLYVRQCFLNKPSLGHEFGWQDEFSPITEEMEKSQKLNHYEILLSFYKSHEESFSEHPIIGICIKLFVFIDSIAKQVARYYHFVEELNSSIEHISDFDKNSNVALFQKESVIVWSFLKQITVKIEIERHFSEEEIKKGFPSSYLIPYIFQKKPVSFFMNLELKKRFFQTVKIKSLEEKHDDFYNIIEEYDEILETHQNSFKKNKFLYYLINDTTLGDIRLLLFIISAILNLLLIIYYNGISQNYKKNGIGNGKPGVLVMTIIAIVAGFVLLICWFIANYTFNCNEAINQYYRIKIKRSQFGFKEKVKIYLLSGFLFRSEFLFDVFYIAIHFIGWFVNPVFYVLGLFIIIQLNETINGIVVCFIRNGGKLLLAIVMIAMVINFYSYILSDQLIPYLALNFENANMCDTYFKCFMNTMNVGNYKDEGIASVMIHVPLTRDPHFIGRFFFDVSYYFAVQVLLFAIYFGIVIDAFEEFKREEINREKDRENVCFVCGLNKEALEKNNINFRDHRKYHNIWNYFFYAQYLKRFPENDFNGTDIYVSELLKKKQLTWMPKLKTHEVEIKKNL